MENLQEETNANQDNKSSLRPMLAADAGINGLLSLLAEHGGAIISSNDLHPDLIAQAKASNRMYIDENCLGYVWEPPFAGRFPRNEKELDLFKRCYPLDFELPEKLKNTDWIDRITKENVFNYFNSLKK